MSQPNAAANPEARHTVILGVQPGSQHCFVCGRANLAGLGITAYYHDDTQVWAEASPGHQYEGWPGVTHGGILTALLDEVMGRVSFLTDRWSMTGKLELRFVRPARTGERLVISACIARDMRRAFDVTGEIRALPPDFPADATPEPGIGEKVAEATGLFVRVPDSVRTDMSRAFAGADHNTYQEWWEAFQERLKEQEQ